MSSQSVSFDRAAEYYDETRGFPPGQEQPVAALMAQAGGLNSTSRVLEIGIGTGRIALPLALHVGEVVGVDLSRPMLNRLRAKQTTEPVEVTVGDADSIALPGGIVRRGRGGAHLSPDRQLAGRAERSGAGAAPGGVC